MTLENHMNPFRPGHEARDPGEPGPLSDPDALQRFGEKIDFGEQDECWEWIGARHPRGYGQIRIDYELYYAHRVSWAIRWGVVDPKTIRMVIRHTCNHEPCVNWRHLKIGTQQLNIRDAVRSGRMGTVAGDVDVIRLILELRADGLSSHEIADHESTPDMDPELPGRIWRGHHTNDYYGNITVDELDRIRKQSNRL